MTHWLVTYYTQDLFPELRFNGNYPYMVSLNKQTKILYTVTLLPTQSRFIGTVPIGNSIIFLIS